jgi:hypothetical protein
VWFVLVNSPKLEAPTTQMGAALPKEVALIKSMINNCCMGGALVGSRQGICCDVSEQDQPHGLRARQRGGAGRHSQGGAGRAAASSKLPGQWQQHSQLALSQHQAPSASIAHCHAHLTHHALRLPR